MLGTLENKDKTQWRNFVKPFVHAYNCTKNNVTGFMPYELMFGRQPWLPVDLAFGLPAKVFKTHSQYVQNLKSHLEESYRIAASNANKIAKKNKERFDKHVTASINKIVKNCKDLTKVGIIYLARKNVIYKSKT